MSVCVVFLLVNKCICHLCNKLTYSLTYLVQCYDKVNCRTNAGFIAPPTMSSLVYAYDYDHCMHTYKPSQSVPL